MDTREKTQRPYLAPRKKPAIPIHYPFTFARYSLPHRQHPERNEDCLLVDRRRGLAAVFDGVGGRSNGDLAAQAASHYIRTHWKQILGQVQPSSLWLSSSTQLDLVTTLQKLIQDTNLYIRQVSQHYAESQSLPLDTFVYPGTTCVLAILQTSPDHHYTLTCAHVGDCRGYIIRPMDTNEPVKRLTQDDGYFTYWVRRGDFSYDDALRIEQAFTSEQLTHREIECFYMRNKITQALGWARPVEVHIHSWHLTPGDRILLCSDGIHDNLTDQEIALLLHNRAPNIAARQLVLQAAQRSQQDRKVVLRAKPDDMSAIVITYHVQ